MAEGKMTKEQKLLLCVLKRAINGVQSDFDGDLSAIDWTAFIKESFFQAVSYITFENAGFLKPNIPEDLYQKWSARILKSVVSNVNVVNAQRNLITLLGDKYKYLILKGLAAASFYPNPELRDLGDVDFLIDTSEQEEIKNLLIKNGFECDEEDKDHHIVFTKPSAHLEMHFEIPGIPYGEKGDKVRQFMAGALEDCVKTTVDSKLIGDFVAPDKKRHGLILILHMQHHMLGEGLGLRHLTDWACFVNKTASESFWEELLAFFKEIGIFVYAAAMTKTCSVYLGSVCPEWCNDVSIELCEEIMLDVLSLGNFGRKDAGKSRSGSFISDHGKDGTKNGKMLRIWRQFNSSVKSRHKSLEKHKILYPFFYVYEFFRYLFDAMRGKRPKINKLLSDADDRKSVYEKLHVFETE